MEAKIIKVIRFFIRVGIIGLVLYLLSYAFKNSILEFVGIALSSFSIVGITTIAVLSMFYDLDI